MLVVILIYDQLLFRPLLAWSRFKVERSRATRTWRPGFSIMLQRARLFDLVQAGVLAVNRWHRPRLADGWPRRAVPSAHGRPRRGARPVCRRSPGRRLLARRLPHGWIVASSSATCRASRDRLGVRARRDHAVRVLVLIALASLIWVPIGVVDRPAPAHRRPGAADRAVPGGVSGQSVLPGGGVADRALSSSTPRSG